MSCICRRLSNRETTKKKKRQPMFTFTFEKFNNQIIVAKLLLYNCNQIIKFYDYSVKVLKIKKQILVNNVEQMRTAHAHSGECVHFTYTVLTGAWPIWLINCLGGVTVRLTLLFDSAKDCSNLSKKLKKRRQSDQ
ncbi:hypothetical protein BpHYR1_039340 [Brachionus plicatilis]|uniref:Uncharacterized protein n=1 Tax=Brachionus plicatilis TaxID=10195 RepID=A0A3M7SV31_BRAPC|nr:hypothetical protein BpHYR1_039340 [Brachionus plicatilis]